MKDYSLQQQTAGLLALVACAGNANMAAGFLRDQSIEIPPSTLKSWMSSKREEYERLREEYAPQLEAELVHQMRQLAIYTATVQRKAVEEAEWRLDNKKDIQPAQTAANLAKVMGANTDKLLALTGRPSQITEHRNAEELIRSLVAKRVLVIDGSEAKELPAMTPETDHA